MTMTAIKKRRGVADRYPRLSGDLDMAGAKVTFDGTKISYQKKDDDGKLTAATLSKSYPRHACGIIYSRLKNGDEVYLLHLIQKVEREKTAEKIRRLS